jgi:hypothetical protein
MDLLHLIESIPNDVAIRTQMVAAIAIYFAIVFAATALALTIAYESVVTRGDGRPGEIEPDEGQPLPRAA